MHAIAFAVIFSIDKPHSDPARCADYSAADNAPLTVASTSGDR